MESDGESPMPHEGQISPPHGQNPYPFKQIGTIFPWFMFFLEEFSPYSNAIVTICFENAFLL